MRLRTLLGFLLFLFVFNCLNAEAAQRPPNVIFILTDNQGDWTLGCYGNKDIKTPHIDQLAAEGMRFVNSFASNPVCSPNRATLLTGLMPSQHGVHSYFGVGFPQMGPGAYCSIAEFPTLPKTLKARGYACGLVGKWHLGANLTPQEGFTEEWVTMPLGSTSTFFNSDVIENGAVRKEPMHLTQFWTQRALKFIDRFADKPFFLYLAYNGPYGLGPAQLKDTERVPHWGDYADKELPSFPRTKMHPWMFNNKDYLNNITCIRRYAAEVTTIDDGVGEIMAKLKALGIDDNTIIIFAGDNGWAGGQNGIWGMGDHTRPLSAFDAEMRVPLIWRHPGKIPAGQTSDLMVSHVNFFSTLMDYLREGKDMPVTARKPARSYAPVLKGQKISDWNNTLFYEFENMRCIRTLDAKLTERIAGDPSEYYHLNDDPGEEHNLWDKLDAKGEAMRKRLHEYFDANADPRFDLWHGGKSKAKPHVFPKAVGETRVLRRRITPPPHPARASP